MKIKKSIFTLLDDATKALFKPVKPADAKPEWKDEDAEEFDNGEEEVTGLKSSLEAERKVAKERGEKLKKFEQAETDAEKTKREAAEAAARASGDVGALEKSWAAKEKVALDEAAAAKKEVERMKGDAYRKTIRDQVSDIFVVPAAQEALIDSRIRIDFVDGKPVERILDASGNPSALTIAELRNEYLTNATFKPILKAGNGSGGGADKPASNGGAAPTKISDFKNLTEESRFAKDNPDAYKAMEAAKAAGQ